MIFKKFFKLKDLKNLMIEQREIKTKEAKNKFLKRKLLESRISKQAQKEEDQRIKDLKLQKKTTTFVIKNFTSTIILRIVGALFQSIISLLACVTFVANTYLTNTEYQPFFTTIEITFAVLFSIDYAWGFYNAKNKVK